MKRIELIIRGAPLAKQSARFAKRKGKIRSYVEGKYKRAKTANILQIKSQLPDDWELLQGSVIIERLLFVLPATKAHKGSKGRRKHLEDGGFFVHNKKPDLPDNLPKLLFDSLSGLVFKDDCLIWKVENSCKVYGLDPRVEITISGAIESTGFEFCTLTEINNQS